MIRLSFLPDIIDKDNLDFIECSGNITDVKEFTPSLTDESFYRPSSEFIRELPYMNHDNLAYDFPDGIENHSVDISLRRPIDDISVLSVKARASKRSVDEMLSDDLEEQIYNDKISSLKDSAQDNLLDTSLKSNTSS